MPYNPRLARATQGLSRRMFLKAIALGLSVPLASKLARVALAGPPTPPKRFFLLYMPHGIPVEHYNPQVAAGDPTNFALDQTGVSILGPLQKYNQKGKSYVNVYQGFKYQGGTTHEGIVNCLSGKGGTDTTTPRTSVDQVIAHGLNAKSLILGACSHQVFGMDNHGMLFWDGTPIDPQKNPVAVFDSTWGAQQMTNPGMADAQLRSQLLALTETEIQGLQKELGQLTTEQNKLQVHLEAIQALQSSAGTSAMNTCTTVPKLSAVEMVRSASLGKPSSGNNDWFYQEANFQMLFQAQLQVAAQALVCNAAQVVGLMPMYATCGFDFSFTWTGANKPSMADWSHHLGLSHTTPQASPTAMYNSPMSVQNYQSTTREAFAKAQLWFAQQLDTYVLQVLANTPDPSGMPGQMVLDNSLVYWMSEIGDGADHDTGSKNLYPQVPEYLPMVSIGKCGGALKTGQVVNVTPNLPANMTPMDRPAGDLYMTFCKAMGVPNATFPDATGPVTEVLS
jgi:hypothetical protein